MSVQTVHRAKPSSMFLAELRRSYQEFLSAMRAHALDRSQSGAILPNDEQFAIANNGHSPSTVTWLAGGDKVPMIQMNVSVEVVGNQGTTSKAITRHPFNHDAAPVTGMRTRSYFLIEHNSRFESISIFVRQWMIWIPYHPSCRRICFLCRSTLSWYGIKSFPILSGINISANTALSTAASFYYYILAAIWMPRWAVSFEAIVHRPIITLTQEYDNG